VDRSRCAIIVPYHHHIEPACEDSLRGLERLGYLVTRRGGASGIDLARSELATSALSDKQWDEIVWVDSDVSFEPESVDKLRSHGLPLVGGLYARKGVKSFASAMPSGTTDLTVGDAGGLVEARYIATGFLLTHRRVYEDIARVFDLPVCNQAFGRPTVPYFLPMVRRDPERGFWYMSEDWSFCERAIQAGYRPMMDTSIRLWHVGSYKYGWEDVATPIARVASIQLKGNNDPPRSGS
jgi:hypothetical protein